MERSKSICYSQSSTNSVINKSPATNCSVSRRRRLSQAELNGPFKSTYYDNNQHKLSKTKSSLSYINGHDYYIQYQQKRKRTRYGNGVGGDELVSNVVPINNNLSNNSMTLPVPSVFLLSFILLFVCCSQPCIVNCDIFSSTAHIQSLMHLERHLVSSLQSYIENVEEKMHQVRSYLSEFAYTAGQTRYAGTYADNLMENPLQAFQLLKRLTVNWNKIQKSMTDDSWLPVTEFIENYRTLLPSQDDLNGAALGLIRLQDTYNLNMTDLANGRIYGLNSFIEMSARDCLYLGKNAFNNGYYGHSLEWFDEAMVRAQREGNRTVSVDEIMPFYQMAIEYHDKLNVEFQKHDYPQYSDKLRVVEGDSEDYRSYQKLCRNEKLDTTTAKKVANPREQRCFFTNNNRNPYLVIRPLKVELFSAHPYIAMFHDLMSDSEIEIYKQLATPSLTRARVQTEDNDDEISKVRVSQTAWFSEHTHPLVARINSRIEAVTGLSVDIDKSNCELIQIANYGIGGHYIPHYDYLIKDKPEEERDNVSEKEKYAGDRLATFMFYLSNVLSGGSTVFTRLGIRVTPVKGAAIFWYNLYRNGEGIVDTVHGACPVLVGEKWVANYWIREHGQLFRRPCTLDSEE